MHSLSIRRALATSVTASMLGTAWFAVAQGVTWTMLLECLNATGTVFGITMALQQLAVLVQLPAAVLGERLGRRRSLWGWTALLHRLAWFVPPLVLLVGTPSAGWVLPLFVLTNTVSALLMNASAPLWFSWMADLVPPQIGGRFWGFRQAITSLSFVLAAAAAGWFLDHFGDPRVNGGNYTGFIALIAIAAVLGTADILLHWVVPEPPPHRRGEHSPGVLGTFRELMGNCDFRNLTLGMGVWVFTVGLIGPFGPVYQKQDLALSYTELACLAVGGAIGGIGGGLLWGPLIDRIGSRRLSLTLVCIAPLVGIPFYLLLPAGTPRIEILPGWSTSVHMLLLLPASLLGGALFSGVGLAQFQLAGALSPRHCRTFAMGVHWTLTGLLAMAGPLVGGFIMDAWKHLPVVLCLPSGRPASFFHLLLVLEFAVAALIASPLLMRISETRAPLDGPVFALLRTGNPLRLVFHQLTFLGGRPGQPEDAPPAAPVP